MSYLVSLADKLMTTPIETLESMYNESVSKSVGENKEKYEQICKLIEQVAHNRVHAVEKVGDIFKIVPIF